jgi:hypothetical protein
MEAWRGMGDPLGWRPPLCEGWRGLALRHRSGAKRRAGGWRSDPMREAGTPSTGECAFRGCPPHRG